MAVTRLPSIDTDEPARIRVKARFAPAEDAIGPFLSPLPRIVI
jgi:hypothetical protein